VWGGTPEAENVCMYECMDVWVYVCLYVRVISHRKNHGKRPHTYMDLLP